MFLYDTLIEYVQNRIIFNNYNLVSYLSIDTEIIFILGTSFQHRHILFKIIYFNKKPVSMVTIALHKIFLTCIKCLLHEYFS